MNKEKYIETKKNDYNKLYNSPTNVVKWLIEIIKKITSLSIKRR